MGTLTQAQWTAYVIPLFAAPGHCHAVVTAGSHEQGWMRLSVSVRPSLRSKTEADTDEFRNQSSGQ
eukprot:447071-Rhodomonas_salina.4